MSKLEKEHDCSKCPEATKSKCKEFNQKKVDDFIAMKSKMTDLILQSSQSISINGDKDVYHYFNELKTFLQAQMDLMSSSGWVSEGDIRLSDDICKIAYKKEMEIIKEVKKVVHSDHKEG
jgi:hypothetical protein